MKKLIFTLVLFTVLCSCSDQETDIVLNKDSASIDNLFITTPHTTLDTLQTTDSIKEKLTDSVRTHIFKSGETLWALGRKYYGNRHYSSLTVFYNQIENVNKIEPGTLIKVPPFNDMLLDTDFGLVPIMQEEVEKIITIRELFMKHQQLLSDIREDKKRDERLDLPANTVADLQKANKLTQDIIESLKKPKGVNKSIPKSMINQLKNVSKNLDQLSKGIHDGPYKYDLDMFHQNLIHAIKGGISWAKKVNE